MESSVLQSYPARLIMATAASRCRSVTYSRQESAARAGQTQTNIAISEPAALSVTKVLIFTTFYSLPFGRPVLQPRLNQSRAAASISGITSDSGAWAFLILQPPRGSLA